MRMTMGFLIFAWQVVILDLMCMKSQIFCEKHKKSKVACFFLTGGDIKKGHGGVLPWAAMPLTAGNDRKKAAALISQNRHQ